MKARPTGESPLKRLRRFFHREPDFIIGGPDDPYLLRWWVIPRNRFFNIYLHKFLRDDDDRALHDHPWVSLSIILRGGYIEHLPGGARKRRYAGQLVFRRAKHAHRIELLREFLGFLEAPGSPDFGKPIFDLPQPAWTIFITGPKIREWGFHCPQGWRHWREFTAPGDSSRVGKGCEP